MRSLLLVICAGCYATGTTPAARETGRALGIVEMVAGAVLVGGGALAQRDYNRDPEATPPDNAAALILLTAGVVTGLAGLYSWSNNH